MTDQQSTTDLFSMWQGWNKANQEWWTQMLQSWIESEAFAHALGKAMENYLVAYNAFAWPAQASMEQALRKMLITSAGKTTPSMKAGGEP
jgi:hypothetical protein